VNEPEKTYQEHVALLEAVEADDPERVETLIAQHFNRTVKTE
jgi:DNA-binding GntR family transcriptional regulator